MAPLSAEAALGCEGASGDSCGPDHPSRKVSGLGASEMEPHRLGTVIWRQAKQVMCPSSRLRPEQRRVRLPPQRTSPGPLHPHHGQQVSSPSPKWGDVPTDTRPQEPSDGTRLTTRGNGQAQTCQRPAGAVSQAGQERIATSARTLVSPGWSLGKAAETSGGQ